MWPVTHMDMCNFYKVCLCQLPSLLFAWGCFLKGEAMESAPAPQVLARSASWLRQGRQMPPPPP